MFNPANKENHLLPDVLEHGLTTVFCGRAPSPESRRRGAYYAHPTNMFWKILAETGLTDRCLKPEEFRELPRFGIGLTDLNKFEFGSDHELTGEGDNPIEVYEKVVYYRPKILAFTGKNNGSMFLASVFGRSRSRPVSCGEQDDCRIGETRIVILPSTSARAKGYWDSRYWEELALLHNARSHL
ncbi:MAG: mismatch-specific DNA-glycosylase [Acidiferrobacterales bacterium]|nr:mismatch-specific DNA-glycosylase [Acidiferrobacterales bacterium]